MSPSGFHRQLCWRPLSSPSPAPASFLRKLGSPRSRSALGGSLCSVPCCSAADIQADGRGVRRPPRHPTCTRASPGRWERLRGRVQTEGGEACQHLGPVPAPGRPQRSCSLQQVRRTRARSLLLSRHLLRPRDPSHRPAPQSCLPAAASSPRLPFPLP